MSKLIRIHMNIALWQISVEANCISAFRKLYQFDRVSRVPSTEKKWARVTNFIFWRQKHAILRMIGMHFGRLFFWSKLTHWLLPLNSYSTLQYTTIFKNEANQFVSPIHKSIPIMSDENELLYEMQTFVIFIIAMCTQYLNLFRTYWWQSDTYRRYAMVC